MTCCNCELKIDAYRNMVIKNYLFDYQATWKVMDERRGRPGRRSVRFGWKRADWYPPLRPETSDLCCKLLGTVSG